MAQPCSKIYSQVLCRSPLGGLVDGLKLSQQGKQRVMATLGDMSCSEYAVTDDVADLPCRKMQASSYALRCGRRWSVVGGKMLLLGSGNRLPQLRVSSGHATGPGVAPAPLSFLGKLPVKLSSADTLALLFRQCCDLQMLRNHIQCGSV